MKRTYKYKVGDILEYWSVDRDHEPERFMVTGYSNDYYIRHYVLTPLDDIHYGGLFTKNNVDMTHWDEYTRLCRSGWRRIG